MSDVRTADRPRNAVPLPANSFDFRELEKKFEQARRVQDDSKVPGRLADAIAETAKIPEVLERNRTVALPEGTELQTIETTAGQKVKAPVAIPADAESGAEAMKLETPARVQQAEAAESPAPAGSAAAEASATRGTADKA